MKNKFLLTAALVTGVTVAVFSACSKDKLVDDTGDDPQGQVITMKGGVYSNADVALVPGTRITWINDDNMTHTVTSDEGAFNSGDINPGGRFTMTLDSIGVYPYHCMHHPSMTGVVRIVIR